MAYLRLCLFAVLYRCINLIPHSERERVRGRGFVCHAPSGSLDRSEETKGSCTEVVFVYSTRCVWNSSSSYFWGRGV